MQTEINLTRKQILKDPQLTNLYQHLSHIQQALRHADQLHRHMIHALCQLYQLNDQIFQDPCQTINGLLNHRITIDCQQLAALNTALKSINADRQQTMDHLQSKKIERSVK